MNAAIAMDADQIRYRPNDYPLFKLALFNHLTQRNIEEIMVFLQIPPGQMDGGTNEGGDVTLKMVSLLEQKGYIRENSIQTLINPLRELNFNGTADTIEELYQHSLSHQNSAFGPFKVALAKQFTNNIMYGLATLLRFPPAEMNELGLIPDGKGMKMVFLLEQANIINGNDVSTLLNALEKLGLQDLLTKLKAFTTEYDDLR